MHTRAGMTESSTTLTVRCRSCDNAPRPRPGEQEGPVPAFGPFEPKRFTFGLGRLACSSECIFIYTVSTVLN